MAYSALMAPSDTENLVLSETPLTDSGKQFDNHNEAQKTVLKGPTIFNTDGMKLMQFAQTSLGSLQVHCSVSCELAAVARLTALLIFTSAHHQRQLLQVQV